MVSERGLEVLRVIVQDYVASREPVGSKSIVDRYGFGALDASNGVPLAWNPGRSPGGRVHPRVGGGRVGGGRPVRVVELLRKYPNLCCDLSAGSGENAIRRDPEFGYAFLEEFQDRLYFGTDICAPHNEMGLSKYLDEAVTQGHISQIAYEKICRENALRLLNR